MNASMFVLMTITILILNSCSQKPGTKADFKFSLDSVTREFATADFAGGLVVFGKSNSGQSFSRIIGNDSTSVSETLPNGVWNFYAIGWSGQDINKNPTGKLSGETKCASSGAVELNGTATDINLTVSKEKCSEYGATENGIFQKPNISFCDVIPAIANSDAAYLCKYEPENNIRTKSFIRSFKFTISGHQQNPNEPVTNVGSSESSSCINLADSTFSKLGSDSISNAISIPNSLPFFANLKLIPYFSANCTNEDFKASPILLTNGLKNNKENLTQFTDSNNRLLIRIPNNSFCSKINNTNLATSLVGLNQYSPHMICTKHQLSLVISNNFAQLKDHSFILMNHINFWFGVNPEDGASHPGSLTPLGYNNGGTPFEFNGSFDGNNKKIIGLAIEGQNNLGLFSSLGTKAFISNLQMIGTEIYTEAEETQAINMGVIAGKSKGLIKEVIALHSRLDGGENVGGLVGLMEAETFANNGTNTVITGRILNSESNFSHIRAQRTAGGLVGKIKADSTESTNNVTINLIHQSRTNDGSVTLENHINQCIDTTALLAVNCSGGEFRNGKCILREFINGDTVSNCIAPERWEASYCYKQTVATESGCVALGADYNWLNGKCINTTLHTQANCETYTNHQFMNLNNCYVQYDKTNCNTAPKLWYSGQNGGGLVGELISSTSTKVIFKINESQATVMLTGNSILGGLVGSIKNKLKITDSYSLTDIHATDANKQDDNDTVLTGGIAGLSSGTLELNNVFHSKGGLNIDPTKEQKTIVGSHISGTMMCTNVFVSQPIEFQGTDNGCIGVSNLSHNEIRNKNFLPFPDCSSQSTSTLCFDDNLYDVPKLSWEPARDCHNRFEDMGLVDANKAHSEDNPYLICSANHLEALEGANNYFKLGDHIDLSGFGEVASIIGSFNGKLNGNKKIISNFLSSNVSGEANTGIFSIIESNGEIKNLFVRNALVKNTEPEILSSSILAGKNSGLIEKVKVTGFINGIGDTGAELGTPTGLIVGINNSDGNIFDSEANGKILVDSSYAYQIGGVTGSNLGTISSSTSNAQIYLTAVADNASLIGGIAGENSGDISEVEFKKGLIHIDSGVVGVDSIGGIAGKNSGSVENTLASWSLEDMTFVHAPPSACAHTQIYGVGGIVGETTAVSFTKNNISDFKSSIFIFPGCVEAGDKWGPTTGVGVSGNIEKNLYLVSALDNHHFIPSIFGKVGTTAIAMNSNMTNGAANIGSYADFDIELKDDSSVSCDKIWILDQHQAFLCSVDNSEDREDFMNVIYKYRNEI